MINPITKEILESQILKITARIIGTAIQKDTLTGKYADEFEKYRNEIIEIISEAYEAGYKKGVSDEVECIEKSGEHSESVKRIRQSTISEIIELLPEEETKYMSSERQESIEFYLKGFNACRSQILEKLGVKK